MKEKRVSFFTLGCRLNQSETAVIERDFRISGYKVVDFNEPADMVVINTCTVTEGGDGETRRLINKAARTNPTTRIALIGCQAQVQKEAISDHPNVAWVVGNARKMDLKTIVEELDGRTASRRAPAPAKHVITPAIERRSFTQEIAAIDEHHTRAFMKIQDGCDFFCSFCEIPYARGRSRSREFPDIIREARLLAETGHQEIVLTGINIGTYDQNKKSLLDVINALEEIPGLQRIRISSIEPTTIPRELIKKMGRQGKLCPYLHIPLQSANNEILSAMKRKYTFEEFLDFIQTARSLVEGICIGTDVIVGFPGETPEHFRQTEERLRASSIDYFHVFSYSQRTMNKSRQLTGEVDRAAIKERSRLLRELSLRKRAMFHDSLLGSTQRVLFEVKRNGLWSGWSDNYARIYVSHEGDLKNKLERVRIDALKNGKLIASFGQSGPDHLQA